MRDRLFAVYPVKLCKGDRNMSEIQKQVISWQREYHALTTQLMEMDDKPPMFDTFRDYVEAVEDILS